LTKDRYIPVFLSSAMNGELDIERNSIRTLFRENALAKDFYSLFAIEEHASPEMIQKAFTYEVLSSTILILILGDNFREAVIEEYQTARKSGKRVFVYIKSSKNRSDALSEFISSEIYKYNPGAFHDAVDLCERIKRDLKADMIKAYNPQWAKDAAEIPYVRTQSSTPYSADRFYSYDTIKKIAEKKNIKPLSIDQLMQYSTILSDESGDLRGALLLIEIGLLQEPDNWMLHNNRGLLLNAMGFIQNAIHAYERALSNNPNSDSAHYNLGGAYYELGQYPKAIQHLEASLEIYPDKENAFSRLSACYLRLSNGKKALEYAKKAILLKESESNIVNLSSSLALVGEYIEAKDVAKKLSDEHSKYRVMIAHIHYLQKEYEQALTLINEIELSGTLEYKTALIKYYSMLFCRDSTAAVKWLSEMEKRFPIRAVDYNDMGYNLMKEFGYSAEVSTILRKCVSEDPRIGEAWANLQANLGGLGENDLGLEVCNDALTHSPHDPKSIQNKIKFLLNLGRYSEAVEFTFEKAFTTLGSDPNNDPFSKVLKESFSDIVNLYEEAHKNMMDQPDSSEDFNKVL
jgi:tetratricopeptide (TPR) repeat protein